MQSSQTTPTGLQQLEERLRTELSYLNLPAGVWVAERRIGEQPLLPVAIIGGGMAGICVATALLYSGVPVEVYDQSADQLEGPWLTSARMETLRSPKELTGPALGIPSLTFRAWFTAQFGEQAWQALDKIPRPQWAEYLHWLKRMSGVTVHNRMRAERIEPTANGYSRLTFRNLDSGETSEVLARRVILATGRDGLGGPWMPDWAQELPADRRFHSSDLWANDAFRGKRVVVIGVGASAMDCAATALENGASKVHLLARRQQIPRINKSKGSGSMGMAHGFWKLSDDWKWRIRHYINKQQVPPPKGSTLRVSRFPNAYFHTHVWVESAHVNPDGSIRLITNQGPLDTDVVIFSTGFRINLEVRPEFAAFASSIRRWGDRYQPSVGQEDIELFDSPDLGEAFEFQARPGTSCPGLERIHCFCYPATLSHGAVAGDIPQISDGAQRLARALCAAFLREDIDTHFAQLEAYSEPELDGDEWEEVPLPGAQSETLFRNA